MIKLSYFEHSEKGGRATNQDFWAAKIEDAWAFFVVADGLGGHTRGDIASEELCLAFQAHIAEYSEKIPLNPMATLFAFIKQSVQTMRENITTKHGNIDTETTFALAWVNNERLLTAHVGDSRIYRLNPTEMLWRSSDHTPLQELFEKGEISEEDFSSHPLQNRLLRSVNIFEEPAPEIVIHPPLVQGETLVLCTDGFWAYLHPQDVLLLAQTNNIDASVHHLCTKIIHQYGKASDNITIQVIRLI